MSNRADFIEYLDPTAARTRSAAQRDPTARQAMGNAAFAGKSLAFVDNGWKSFGTMARDIGQKLHERHGIGRIEHHEIPSSTGMSREVFERVVARSDYAIVGMAN